MNKINNDLKYLILLWFALLALIIPTYAHHGQLLVDCGREVYYPVQVLQGKVLYKDLFNIYGPFAYMLNAFLFKIFGINLNVLYIFGCFCAYAITTLIYLIARRFLIGFLSFSIAFFTVIIGVSNLNLFNFIFPYSYAMLYGIVAFLASVFFLIEYKKKSEKIGFLYLSSFFAGLCITSKYEFLPYILVVFAGIFAIKKLKVSEYYYAFFALLFIPVFCFGLLFLQGLRIADLINCVNLVLKMSQTQTLKYFYLTQGVYFDKRTPLMLLNFFMQTVFPLAAFCVGLKSNKSFVRIVLPILSVIFMMVFLNPASFAFLPIFLVILVLIDLKNLKSNLPLAILAFSALLVSIKVFWGLATLNYGAFFISYFLVSAFALLLDIFKDKAFSKDMLQKAIASYLLFVAVVFGIQNISMLKVKSFLIKTPRGQIYTTNGMSYATGDLINYLKLNTKKSDAVVVLPESPFINFLVDRKSDGFYNSLIPLYVETFGEENIINHFEQTKPEYIVFNNRDTSDYGQPFICKDYALGVCGYVVQNYSQVAVIDKGLRYLIFKRNTNLPKN